MSVTEGERGSILDRNGKALAQQGSVFQVGLIAGKLGNEADTVSAMARVLDVSEDSIKKALSASWVQDDMFVPIKTITAAKRAEVFVSWALCPRGFFVCLRSEYYEKKYKQINIIGPDISTSSGVHSFKKF